VSSDGVQGNDYSFNPAISANGRFVSFASAASNLVENDTNYSGDVFVHDRKTGETERVSVSSDGTQGSGTSFDSAISANGRFLAFTSFASNLVSGDTNDDQDVFVRGPLR
jgi:Tol biopolymer transport system component